MAAASPAAITHAEPADGAAAVSRLDAADQRAPSGEAAARSSARTEDVENARSGGGASTRSMQFGARGAVRKGLRAFSVIGPLRPTGPDPVTQAVRLQNHVGKTSAKRRLAETTWRNSGPPPSRIFSLIAMSLYLGHQPRVRPTKSGDIVKEVCLLKPRL